MKKYSQKTKLTYESLALFLFGLQIYIQNIAMRSALYEVIVFLYIGIILINILHSKKITLNITYKFWIVFAVYNFLLIVWGDTYNYNHSIKYLSTFIMNLILYIFSFNLFNITNMLERILSTYINAIVLSSLTIMWGQRATLFTSRMGQSGWREVETYKILGFNLVSVGANGLSFMCSMSLVFIIILYYHSNKRENIIKYIILIITILFTGSRQGILLAILGIGIVVLLYSKNLYKKIKVVLLGLSLMIAIYLLVQKIPFLYEKIGERLNQLIIKFIGGEVIDSSINTREMLISRGMDYFYNNIFWGYGLDAFRIMYSGICADNNFVDILVSSGIIGFCLYYAYVPIYFCYYLKNKLTIKKVAILLIMLSTLFHYGSTVYYNRIEGPVICILFYIVNMKRRQKNGEYEVEKIN